MSADQPAAPAIDEVAVEIPGEVVDRMGADAAAAGIVSHNAAAGELEKSAAELHDQREVGGRGGLEPTRYGDWEKNGRCIDF
jgi:hypothetical protein